MRHHLLALAFVVSGLLLIAPDWRVALGVLLIVWGNNMNRVQS